MKNIKFIPLFLFLFFIGPIFFLLTVTYPNSTFDHISYLYGSLNLYQNISPGYFHAPGGIYFWIGDIYLQLEFLINFISDLRSNGSNIESFYQMNEKILTDNYKNLYNLKLFYNFFSFTILTLIVYLVSKKFENFKFIFFFTTICLSSSFLFKFLIQPTPYILSWLLSILAILLLKKKQNNWSIIFASIALSLRFENILLIFLLLSFKWNDKIFLKKLFLISIFIFFISNPWSLISPYGTIKTLFSYFFLTKSKSFFEIDFLSLSYFLIIFFICMYFLHLRRVKSSFYLMLGLNILFIIYFLKSIHAEKHLGIIIILNFVSILYFADTNKIKKYIYYFFFFSAILLIINFINIFKIYNQKNYDEIKIIKWIEKNIAKDSIILKPQTIYELNLNKEYYEKFYKDHFGIPNKFYNKKIIENYGINFEEKNFSFMDINSHVNRSNFIRYLFLISNEAAFKIYFEGTNHPYFFTSNNMQNKPFYFLTRDPPLQKYSLIKEFEGNYKLYFVDK